MDLLEATPSAAVEALRSGDLTRHATGDGWFRPVQFLGTKTRVLPALLEVAEAEIHGQGRVCDIFSGSSVVAQGFARSGHLVTAFDALGHCAHFARALLGVGRTCDERLPGAGELPVSEASWVTPWHPWLESEDAAAKVGDADSLIELAGRIPQIWRPSGASAALARVFANLGSGRQAPCSLVAAHYAGTYFGIRQAIEIDLLRRQIAAVREAGRISQWQESAMLTALLSAASECAFSAGKHYAQPHRIRANKDLSFIKRRIVEDRRKSVLQLFATRLETVANAALVGGDHTASVATLEELVQQPNQVGPITAIYADPPYTAQQYSRFYHVPEIIASYRVPVLQRVGGQITRGLYPVDRHKSRFCSRRDAPSAFADLCRLANTKSATLLLSYSYSRTGETGNKRSIDVKQLRSLLAHYFDEVIEREVDVTYRQFNATSVSVEERSDAEVLFIGRRSRA